MRRRGVTLVEVVVLVFLVLVAIAILLPVLYRRPVRDDSRMQTNNNLKQCALAVHNYHDTYRRLPDGFGLGGIYTKVAQEQSIWFHLLPYVEADNVYKNGKPNEVIPAFRAPSDPYNADNSGIVNFAANVRVFGHQTLTPAKVNQPGVALEIPQGVLLAGLTLARIVDGTDNTIMMTTRYSDCGGQKTWYAADVHGTNAYAGLFDKNPFPPSPGVGGFMGAGSYSTPPTTDVDIAPATAMFQIRPKQKNCNPQPGLFGHAFSSSGSLSVALCDASIKNIAPTMSPTTFGRAMSPGDQIPLGDDWMPD